MCPLWTGAAPFGPNATADPSTSVMALKSASDRMATGMMPLIEVDRVGVTTGLDFDVNLKLSLFCLPKDV